MNPRPPTRHHGPAIADLPLPADATIDQRMPRSAQAYDLLRDAIVSLWLKPGEAVNEKAICEQLGGCRMPVPGQLDQIIREHQAILDGLRSGREAQAARALKIHLDTVFVAVQILMDRHAEYFSKESLARLKRRPAPPGSRSRKQTKEQ